MHIVTSQKSKVQSQKKYSVLTSKLAAFLFIFLISDSTVYAQWRIATPRDTVTVPANQKTFITSKITLTTQVEMWLSPSGTFTENDGSTTFGMDAAYTYLINGNSLIPEALNPATYSGKTHKYVFAVTTIAGLVENKFSPLENTYQPSHIYTSRVFSQGNKFQFRMLADKDADYPGATGALNVKMARWTAGIAIQNVNVNFGNVLIGNPATILDSLASYGLDPLQIDSIKLIDTSGDFSFISERDNRFSLPSEQTNELKITFSPSSRGQIGAELHIYSHNADPSSRFRVIALAGFGTAPDFGVGPHQWDFGKVRIGYPKIATTQISNAKGNATLTVTNSSKYIQYQPSPPPNVFSFGPLTILPTNITAGSIGQVGTLFSPRARVKYVGTLELRGNNVKPDSVQFTGEGAEPVPELSPVSRNGALNFGIVYNGNNSQQTLTLTNKGNWPLSVIIARITGASSAVFTFSPSEPEFTLAPDSSRTFTIFFHPGTGQDSLRLQDYFELVYDDFTIDTILLRGIEIEPQVLSSQKICDFGKVRIGAQKDTVATVLRNIGNIPINLQEDEVLPSGPFKELGVVGVLRAREQKPVNIRFKPTIPGPAGAYYFFAANGKRDSVLLIGIGAVAKAIFTPALLDFGIVPSNKTRTLSTILKDSGDYQLRVVRMQITGPNASDFKIITPSQTPFKPFTLEPDSTITITVSFFTNALTGLVHRAQLCVYYDDSTSNCIPLEAIEEAQYLQFGQSSINFGKQRINTHTNPYLHAVFRNGSNKLLSVGAVTATSPANVFAVFDTLKPVNAQSKDSVLVDFFPLTRGTYIGYLHAFGGDIKTDSIQLRGIGAIPLPSFSDTALDFGIVVLGKNKNKTFTLSDTGDWFLKAIKIEIIGANKDEFSYVKVGPQIPVISDSIPESTSATYRVTFAPQKIIVFHTAKMVFTFDDSTQGIVTLTGYDESPKLVLDQDTVNFGKVRIGTIPVNHTINIISTSPDTLKVQNLNLITAAPVNTFSSNPVSGPISVMPRTIYETLYPVTLTFQPSAIGSFTAMLVFSGKDVKDLTGLDTVFITGIGASPMTVLSSKLLDFGTLFPGHSASRSFSVGNTGNWMLSVNTVTITGANNADFTLRNIPSQFTIRQDSSNLFIVDFKATTPYQVAQRTAQIIFTLDDGSKFTVDLIEQDIAPIAVDLRMDSERARIGDNVYPCLRLRTDLPDSLHILDLKGVITYDPTLFDLDRAGVSRGEMILQLGNWNLITNPADIPGQFTYELQGAGAPITKAGSLLRMKFKPHDNDSPGATSPLTNKQFSFPLRTELAATAVDGFLIVDSACGNTHIFSGQATANFVDQNMPNPFGTNTGNNDTQIPFDIGFDNTPVTIRILDVSGREVARPLDNQIFNQGRYLTKVSAAALGSNGSYFYEFRAGDGKPMIMKMMVRK